MPKRTVKHNHLVSTYPCNNGYVTETVNRNGETIRTAFDTNLYDAERRHNNYLRDLQEGGKRRVENVCSYFFEIKIIQIGE